jgi:cation:H+ antiporter
MLATLVQFVLAAGAIVVAGTYLSRFADDLAEQTGLGRMLIGSVLLAGTTSLPELTVDISAVRLGAANLAVGDLLGSSLMNLLILAVLDLSSRSRGKMLSPESAVHALSGGVSGVLTLLVALGLLVGPAWKGMTWGGVSVVLWLVTLVYGLGLRLVYLDQRISLRTPREHSPPHCSPRSLQSAAAGFLICAAVILLAGPWLAHAADRLAELSGLGGTFVGTTLVALSTSLPELVSSLAALRLGAHDLAIGNVFGSNAFNMILLVPLDLVQPGSLLAVVSPTHALTCITAVLGTQVAVLGQVYRVERRRPFIEPDAWLVILVVLSGLGLVYAHR